MAFDNNLKLNVDNIEIEGDDHVFMAMVHLVNPRYFIHTFSTVSRCLAKAPAKTQSS
jgi:hypothetical protein